MPYRMPPGKRSGDLMRPPSPLAAWRKIDARRSVVYFIALLGLVTAPFAIYHDDLGAIAASGLALILPLLDSMARRRGW